MKNKPKYKEQRMKILLTIRKQIEAQKMTHQEVADKVGVVRPVITRLLTGNHSPSIDLLMNVSHSIGLKVSVNKIV